MRCCLGISYARISYDYISYDHIRPMQTNEVIEMIRAYSWNALLADNSGKF
jgi:hypothetical protein